MTDRPPLDDLDAEPEPERWCCSGNAEGCPLCDTAALPYPWICPGHPDTEANRQRVQAAHEAPTPAPWSQLEAHAFNAVQPALNQAGAWLPMSVRRAVARAVLAAVQPHIAGHYQHAVDAAVAAEQRAEQAEALLRRYRAWLAEQHAHAEAADRAGSVPAELRISPHNGIASGLHTALLGLDRFLDMQDSQKPTRHVHITVRNVDEYTANRQALSLVDWINAEFDGLQVTTDAREWPAHNAGPTVRECAEADARWWGGEKAGEQ